MNYIGYILGIPIAIILILINKALNLEGRLELIIFISEIILIMVLIVFVLVSWSAKSQIKQIKKTRKRKSKKFKQLNQFAESNDYNYIGRFKIGFYKMEIWKKCNKSKFMMLHLFPDSAIEFTSFFPKDIILGTVNNRNFNDTPHFPGYYLQTFSKISIEDLWNRHNEMESYLIEKGRFNLSECGIATEDINTYIKKQMKHIQSIPFWPLYGFYWFIIRQYKWHNITIKKQHEKNMIFLPNEIISQNHFGNLG